MKVLGISSDFHDSSAALVVNGRLVASAAEERFTRNKHDAHSPRFATDFCLKYAGISARDLDLVVYYERPFEKWIRVLESSVAQWPQSRQEFVASQSEWLGRKLWARVALAQHLQISPNRIVEIGHHESHVVQAFMGSPFERAGVLTVDAVGENSTASMAEVSWVNDRLQVQQLASAQYPHSLGLFYSAMTAFLGFKPMNDECTTMALAAFGEAKYVSELKQVLSLSEDGFWNISDQFLNFDRFLKAPWTDDFIHLLGQPRDFSRSFVFSSLERNFVSPEEQRWADLAASIQSILEDALVHSVRHLKSQTTSSNLCLAGGVAMNCVANTRIARSGGFSELFIPIEPGDGGASIGAAFAGYYLKGNNSRVSTSYSVYMGAQHDFDSEWIKQIDVAKTWEYQKAQTAVDRRLWEFEIIKNDSEMADRVASAINDHKVVGVVQGRFELGPRALGHRSILFRPDSIELAQRVSREIKNRAAYRPYALMLLPEYADKVLINSPFKSDSCPLRWMQTAIEVAPDAIEKLRAGVHIDGTTRPQILSRRPAESDAVDVVSARGVPLGGVRKETHRASMTHDHLAQDAAPPDELTLMSEVLRKFYAMSGIGAVVNTSLNESGYPLVNTPEEALLIFARTSLDVLVIDNVLIRKVTPC